jgi:hypothetical protein
MTDWKALAAVLDVPLTEEDGPRVVAPLEALERALRPLVSRIPHSTAPWNPEDGAEDSE